MAGVQRRFMRVVAHDCPPCSVMAGRSGGGPGISHQSTASAFALHRDVVVDPSVQPRLAWSWKVTRLPSDGDARDPERNDQAIGLYVAFPRWPAPLRTQRCWWCSSRHRMYRNR